MVFSTKLFAFRSLKMDLHGLDGVEAGCFFEREGLLLVSVVTDGLREGLVKYKNAIAEEMSRVKGNDTNG